MILVSILHADRGGIIIDNVLSAQSFEPGSVQMPEWLALRTGDQ